MFTTSASNEAANQEWLANLKVTNPNGYAAYMRVLAATTKDANLSNTSNSSYDTYRWRTEKKQNDAELAAAMAEMEKYPEIAEYSRTHGQSTGGLGQGGDELVAAVALPAAAAYFAPAAAGEAGATVGSTTALSETGMVGTGTVSAEEGAAWGVGTQAANTTTTTSPSLLGSLLGQGGSNIPAWLGLFGNLWGANQGDGGAAEAADPFASQRPQYQQMLSELMSNPAAFQNTPMFQNALETGTEAVNRGAARSGLLGSGNRLAELQTFGAGLANQNFFQYLNALMPLSGATTGSPAAASNALQTQSQNQSTNYANMLANLAPLLMQYTSYLQED